MKLIEKEKQTFNQKLKNAKVYLKIALVPLVLALLFCGMSVLCAFSSIGLGLEAAGGSLIFLSMLLLFVHLFCAAAWDELPEW